MSYKFEQTQGGRQAFLKTLKQQKQQRELSKKQIEAANKIWAFYTYQRLCNLKLKELISSHQSKINALINAKKDLTNEKFQKGCLNAITKYPIILTPILLVTHHNIYQNWNYFKGLVLIFMTGTQLTTLHRAYFLKLIKVFAYTHQIPYSIECLDFLLQEIFNKNIHYEYLLEGISKLKWEKSIIQGCSKSKQFNLILSRIVKNFPEQQKCDIYYEILSQNITVDQFNGLEQCIDISRTQKFQSLVDQRYLNTEEQKTLLILYKNYTLLLQRVFNTSGLIVLIKMIKQLEYIFNVSQQIEFKDNDLKKYRKNIQYSKLFDTIQFDVLINIIGFQLIGLQQLQNFKSLIEICQFVIFVLTFGKQQKKLLQNSIFPLISNELEKHFQLVVQSQIIDENVMQFLSVDAQTRTYILKQIKDEDFMEIHQQQNYSKVINTYINIMFNLIKMKINHKLQKYIKNFLQEAFTIDSRLNFHEWILDDPFISDLQLYQSVPFVLKFERKLQILNKLMEDDKEKQNRNLQALYDINFLGQIQIKEDRIIRVRRGQYLQDALDQMGNRNLREEYKIQFYNEQNIEEEGIDGGGLTKEFLIRALSEAFDPNKGFFLENKDNRTFTPNPYFFTDDSFMFQFIGKLIGKAIYEGVLVDQVINSVYLNLVLEGRNNFNNMKQFDKQQYNSLLQLRNCDVTNMGLNFTINVECYGQVKEVELCKNGAQLLVTNANKEQFIQSYSNFILNQQFESSSRLFRQGLQQVIDPNWLKMFNCQQLQLLMSGQPKMDIKDMIKYTTFKGYKPDDKTIQYLWQVLQEFNQQEIEQFLFFVTSCSRVPAKGFSGLEPNLQIVKVDMKSNADKLRLPTAQTCFNTLKLPDYRDKNLLKQKLMYAMQSQAGFDLA